MVRDTFYKEKNVQHKDAATIDLVTETDQAVEKLIIENIRKTYPDHSIIAEESYKGGSYNYTKNPTWIVDPIDGTTNFVHRHPFVCVSIALAIDHQVVMGVVYNPIMEELFQAITGKGAMLNGKPIKVGDAKKINQAVIATNVGYDRTPEGIAFMTGMITSLLKNSVQSMRSGGSAAFDVCGVACGRLDIFYEFGIHPWDIAAGVLILQEAGGISLDPSGKPLDMEARRIICGNKDIVAEVIPVIGETKVLDKWLAFGRKE